MRTIGQQAIPKETDLAKFPDSTIVNQTPSIPGTPVVREIYGDILVNHYKLLRDRKINPNGLEDNELNGHQILQAWKRIVNEIVDVEQVLNLAGSTWNINVDLDLLPNKTVVFAKASQPYNDALNYTFKGSGAGPVYNLISTGFSGGDEVMIIIDAALVRVINLSSAVTPASSSQVFSVFGSPISYSDSFNKIWYQEQGKIFSDLPEIYDLQTPIQDDLGDAFQLIDVFNVNNNFVCFVKLGNKYFFYKYAPGNFNAPVQMTCNGFDMLDNAGQDYNLHAFFDSAFLHISNRGQAGDDREFIRCRFDFDTNEVVFVSDYALEGNFVKTTNAVAEQNAIVTFVSGELKAYKYDGSVAVDLGKFNSYVGLLFKIKADPYYTNGEVAKKWQFNV